MALGRGLNMELYCYYSIFRCHCCLPTSQYKEACFPPDPSPFGAVSTRLLASDSGLQLFCCSSDLVSLFVLQGGWGFGSIRAPCSCGRPPWWTARAPGMQPWQNPHSLPWDHHVPWPCHLPRQCPCHLCLLGSIVSWLLSSFAVLATGQAPGMRDRSKVPILWKETSTDISVV